MVGVYIDKVEDIDDVLVLDRVALGSHGKLRVLNFRQ
jgi:hypothetical protein